MALCGFNSFANKLIGSNIVGSPIPINYAWTTENGIFDANWSSICYGNKIFVTLGVNDVSGIVMTTTDTFTWTPQYLTFKNNWKCVCYGNSIFVAVANSVTNTSVMTSSNGTNWTNVTAITGYWNSICYGNNIFVAVGNSGTIMTSTNTGNSWTTSSSGTTNQLNSVCYGNNIFVAVGNSGTIITSPDGKIWTIQSSGTTNQLNSVCYGNNINNNFIAVGANIILTAINSISTWNTQYVYFTDPNTPINLTWTSICTVVLPTKTFFIAVANTHVNMIQRVMSSFNGTLWTLGYATCDNNWSSICSGYDVNNNIIVVAVSNTSDKGYSAMTNLPEIFPTGQNWQIVNLPTKLTHTSGRIICGNGLMGVASSDYNNMYIIQPNGNLQTITFTRKVGIGYFSSGAYGNGIFCFGCYFGNNTPPVNCGVAYSIDNMQNWNYIDLSGSGPNGAVSNSFPSIIYVDKSFYVKSRLANPNISYKITFNINNPGVYTLTPFTLSSTYTSICSVNGYYYASYNNGVYYSTDNINYSQLSLSTSTTFINPLCYGNGFILAGVPNTIMYGYGTNFTSFTFVAILPLISGTGMIGYANGLFVFFGDKIYVSTDPTNLIKTPVKPNIIFQSSYCIYISGKILGISSAGIGYCNVNT